jgi:hypothetical protein
MPPFDQHVARNGELRAGAGRQQRAVVAHAQHGVGHGAFEIACNEVEFTHATSIPARWPELI